MKFKLSNFFSPLRETAEPPWKAVIDKLNEKVRLLSSERDQFHAILQHMREGVLVTDARGGILQANSSFYRLFCIEEPCEGKTILECLMNHEIHETLARSLATQAPQEKEIVFRKNNLEKHLMVHTTPMRGRQNHPSAIVVFFDVTQIRELENARKEFVANVSHELKTPLTSIRGYAETLQHGSLEDTATARRFIEKIEKNALQLQNLIQDLLHLSEIESGRWEFRRESVSLQTLFQEMKNEFSDSLEKGKLSFEIKSAKDVKISADPSTLKQILVNLLSNAIKYTPPGGHVALSARVTDEAAEISVRDTGIGIPPSDLPHIFERFYRVDKARSREMGGTGLGLAIVKHLVQSQGGEVGVESQLGKGSRFFFSVPLGNLG